MWRSRALLAASVLATACGEDPPAECRGPCVRDASNHELVTRECRHSGQCPSGTECRPYTGFEPRSSVEEACRALELPTRCLLESVFDEPSNALVHGFDVPSMPSTVEGTTVSFEPPAGTRLAWCALFRCQPEFVEIGVDEEARAEIVNWTNCVARTGTLGPEERVVDLAQGSPLPPPDEPADLDHAACLPDEVETFLPALPTAVWAGCWAYGDTRVLAATRLWPVDVLEAGLSAGVGLSFVTEEQCASGQGPPFGVEGAACVRPGVFPFGTCRSARCLDRCVVEGDCPAGKARCRVLPGEYVGVCVGG